MVEDSATFSIADTDEATTARLVERWRAMTPAEKLQRVRQASVTIRELEAAGIRARGEAETEEEVWRVILRRRFGETVAAEIFARRKR